MNLKLETESSVSVDWEIFDFALQHKLNHLLLGNKRLQLTQA
jgi:hypothetical protein